MATLQEYFSTYFGTIIPTQFDLSVEPTDGGAAITVVARVYADFGSRTRYISFFIPDGQYSPQIAAYLSQFPQSALSQAAGAINATSSHPAAYGMPTSSSDLPFSGRVFLFIDQNVPDAEKDELVRAAASAGTHLEVRDKSYSDYLTSRETPLAFISHDSRDKAFVGELVTKLRLMTCPVWYDEYSLKVGDSLRESIDKGLREAPKCVVVLSPNFLSNPGWTKQSSMQQWEGTFRVEVQSSCLYGTMYLEPKSKRTVF
jgi:TIR domain